MWISWAVTSIAAQLFFIIVFSVRVLVFVNEFNAKRAPADKLYSFLAENEEWERFMYAKWNDPDNRKLKTAPVNW